MVMKNHHDLVNKNQMLKKETWKDRGYKELENPLGLMMVPCAISQDYNRCSSNYRSYQRMKADHDNYGFIVVFLISWCNFRGVWHRSGWRLFDIDPTTMTQSSCNPLYLAKVYRGSRSLQAQRSFKEGVRPFNSWRWWLVFWLWKIQTPIGNVDMKQSTGKFQQMPIEAFEPCFLIYGRYNKIGWRWMVGRRYEEKIIMCVCMRVFV